MALTETGRELEEALEAAGRPDLAEKVATVENQAGDLSLLGSLQRIAVALETIAKGPS